MKRDFIVGGILLSLIVLIALLLGPLAPEKPTAPTGIKVEISKTKELKRRDTPTVIHPGMFGAVFDAGNSWPPKDGAGNNTMAAECRIWDTGTKMGQVMTVSGPVGSHTYSFSFTSLDKQINDHCKHVAPPQNAPMSVIYTIGDTPAGMALAGAISPGMCGGVAGCCFPDAVNSCRAFDDNTQGDPTETDEGIKVFVATVASRYQAAGHAIDAWEIQNEADTQGFQCWNGVGCGGGANPHKTVNAALLKSLIRRAFDIRKTLDCVSPGAKVYSWSPHVGSIVPGEMFDNFLNSFITTKELVAGTDGYPAGCPRVSSQVVHGYDVIDVMNWHADGGGAFSGANSAETLISSTAALQSEYDKMAAAGHPLPSIFGCDECGYRDGETTTVDERAADVGRRYILAGYLGYQFFDWYKWSSAGIGLEGTLQGTAFNTVYGWLVGSSLDPFVSPSSGTIYTETLTSVSLAHEMILWDTSATNANGGYTCTSIGSPGCTTVNVPVEFSRYISLDGSTNFISNHQVPVNGKPILLIGGINPVLSPPTLQVNGVN